MNIHPFFKPLFPLWYYGGWSLSQLPPVPLSSNHLSLDCGRAPECTARTPRRHGRNACDKAPTSWGITASTNGPTGCSVGPNTRQVQTSGKESDLLWWLTQVKEPLQVNKYQQSSLEETDPWRQVCKHGNGSSLSDVVLSQTRTSFPGCKGQMSSPSGGFFLLFQKHLLIDTKFCDLVIVRQIRLSKK